MSAEVLSKADVAWLHADTATNHFVVTSLALLDERVDAAQLKAMLEQRIPMHPRLRQVVAPAGPFMPERWVDAPNFDLDAHLRRVALPGARGADELATYIGDLAGRPLDLGRPLWETHVIDGPGEGGALVTRFHHALGDGQAMVKMLLTLTDSTRGGWRRPVRERHPRARRRHVHRGAPDLTALARHGVDFAGTVARITLLDPDRPTSLRGDLTLVKRVAWSRPIPLAGVKRVAGATGTTVNDVVVSSIAGALGAHLRAQDEPTRGLRIRAMVPVNLRPPEDTEMKGNRFSLIFLELPVGVTDHRERLMRVRLEMNRIKRSSEPAVGWLLVQGLGFLPTQLEQLTSSFYAAKASLILTNVIGPTERIFMAGSPIRQMTFWEPESGGIGVGVSIYSYAGEITIGAISDHNLVRDPRAITEGTEAAFAALAQQVAARRA